MGRAFRRLVASSLGRYGRWEAFSLLGSFLPDAIGRSQDWKAAGWRGSPGSLQIHCVTLARYLPLSGCKFLLNTWDEETKWSLFIHFIFVYLTFIVYSQKIWVRRINVSHYIQSLDFLFFNMGLLIPAGPTSWAYQGYSRRVPCYRFKCCSPFGAILSGGRGMAKVTPEFSPSF